MAPRGSSCGDKGGAHRKNQLCQVGLGWDTLLGFLSELKSRGAFVLYWQNTHLVSTPVPGHPPSKHKSGTLAPNHEHLTIESCCHQEKLIALFIVPSPCEKFHWCRSHLGWKIKPPQNFYFQICQVQPLGISVANFFASRYLFG